MFGDCLWIVWGLVGDCLGLFCFFRPQTTPKQPQNNPPTTPKHAPNNSPNRLCTRQAPPRTGQKTRVNQNNQGWRPWSTILGNNRLSDSIRLLNKPRLLNRNRLLDEVSQPRACPRARGRACRRPERARSTQQTTRQKQATRQSPYLLKTHGHTAPVCFG